MVGSSEQWKRQDAPVCDYAWRRFHLIEAVSDRAEAIKSGEVERRDEAAVPAPTSRVSSMIEIAVNDAVIRVGIDIDIDIGEDHLRRVIRAVRSA